MRKILPTAQADHQVMPPKDLGVTISVSRKALDTQCLMPGNSWIKPCQIMDRGMKSHSTGARIMLPQPVTT